MIVFAYGTEMKNRGFNIDCNFLCLSSCTCNSLVYITRNKMDEISTWRSVITIDSSRNSHLV